MKGERWQQVERLYHASLERDADGRATFLEEACAGDEGLRREVESLLAYESRAENFIESPALEVAAQMMAEDTSELAGQTIEHYKVISRLGAGGMGEVFLAEDSRLERRVALKFLPTHLTQDKRHLQRFQQEARAVAALSHPNVCVIHEVLETGEGRHCIVMEYVEGATLRERIAEGQMKVGEALDAAIQIASALTSAHAAGVVHRDIKPENVMFRRDGYVKVLDFGLAKLTEKKSELLDSEGETRLVELKTLPGMVMGTVAYMSPEQARGLPVDARTDVWSLGVVLYELATGQKPFGGATPTDVIISIAEREPAPLTSCAPQVPIQLERIVNKALAKDREQRYQTAEDLLIDLKDLKHELEIGAEVERYKQSTPSSGSADTTSNHQEITSSFVAPWLTGSRTALIVLGILILAAAAGWFISRRANVKWAKAQVPKIEALAQAQNYHEAYELAVLSQKYLPQDATITRLMPIISTTVSVKTDPAGAQVYLRRFVPDDAGKPASRQLVGTTPLENLRVARGQYILYVEKDGYAKTERSISGAISYLGTMMRMTPPIVVEQKLIPTGQMPVGMTFVSGGDYRMMAWNRPTDERPRLDDYFIDKYEVSNQEYKEFINAGGYLKQEFWKYPFRKDGRTLSWDEAMKELKDRTGLPGPRSWSSQNFPEGKADHPVTDISWYEASAYAAFKGKQLPTIFQWEKAARNGGAEGNQGATYMPWGMSLAGETLNANFESDGTIAVNGSEFGMSPFGAYNMAGNVSEWCLNETSEGFITTGGDWASPPYTFSSFGTLPGFYSSNKVGFRCALNSSAVVGDQGGMRIEIKNEVPVYAPSSDADFKRWLTHYQYDRTPLDPQIGETKETAEWRREKITFNGADGERAIAYLYLPKNFPGPLQVIHFVPHSGVEDGSLPLSDTTESYLAPFIKSGRAVFGVVLKGYSERPRPDNSVTPEPTTVEYRDRIVNWITDLRRGLDYLETRKDIDSSRIACFTLSAGGRTGLILNAVENRYRSIFMAAAGVRKFTTQWVPETNPINFAPHINGRKLMMHGRYDEILTWKREAEPLYKLLREPKRLVLYDAGHAPPFELFVTTMNGWLDETLGQVGHQ